MSSNFRSAGVCASIAILLQAGHAGAANWVTGGNTLTGATGNKLGSINTTGSWPVEIVVNNARALRFEPGTTPNLIGGHSTNSVTTGVVGGTIFGGGQPGAANLVTDDGGVVGGGGANRAGDNAGTTSDKAAATVGGGAGNVASGNVSVIAGGYYNVASGDLAACGGGAGNHATGVSSFVGGGGFNYATAVHSFVGGGESNEANGDASTVCGGGDAGFPNIADDAFATVAGGFGNLASGTAAFVGGGGENQATGQAAVVVGGNQSMATGPFAVVGGGSGNLAGLDFAVVGGGQNNAASGLAAIIPGGVYNVASGEGSFASGEFNDASGVISFAAGSNNIASGDGGFALGSFARANFDGCFAWGDDSTTTPVACGAANKFVARAAGGVTFYSNSATSLGVSLAANGTSWAVVSDRDAKKEIASVNAQDMLKRFASLPVYSWVYKDDASGARHVGPMAQDFHAVFGLGGNDDKHITTLDADGVMFGAMKGLNAKVERLESENLELRRRLDRLEGGAPLSMAGLLHGSLSGSVALGIGAAGVFFFGKRRGGANRKEDGRAA